MKNKIRTKEEGQGKKIKGRRSREEDQGKKIKGRRASDKEQGKKDKGRRTEDKGRRTREGHGLKYQQEQKGQGTLNVRW